MNAEGWIDLSKDYDEIADRCLEAGDLYRAALWRKNAVACKQAAQLELPIESEQSRKLYDLLAGYDAELRKLEENMTRYTVADYNLRFVDIMRLREQTKKEIEALQK